MSVLQQRRGAGADLARAGFAAVVGFAFGWLTFDAQGFLPAWVSSVANSASGWTVVALLVVVLATDDWRRGAVLTTIVFVLLNVGYYVAADANGLFYDTRTWIVVSVLAGPPIGAAAAVLRERSVRGSVAVAFVGMLLLADGVHSLLTVSATTSSVYWSVVTVIGAGLVGWALKRGPGRRWVLVTLAVTVALAAVGAWWLSVPVDVTPS